VATTGYNNHHAAAVEAAEAEAAAAAAATVVEGVKPPQGRGGLLGPAAD
jgi:hypothetical protein